MTISAEKPLFDCVLHILFLISLHFTVPILHFPQPAPPHECPLWKIVWSGGGRRHFD